MCYVVVYVHMCVLHTSEVTVYFYVYILVLECQVVRGCASDDAQRQCTLCTQPLMHCSLPECVHHTTLYRVATKLRCLYSTLTDAWIWCTNEGVHKRATRGGGGDAQVPPGEERGGGGGGGGGVLQLATRV